ncbi:MAG: helix-turn-helix transcriptional regulator [Synergistes sp.]|nr:helix-turn-helix transcriptional regulator [Synergistes sp.]
MAVTYKKLFKILIDRDLKKQDLAEHANISPTTISKMAAGENNTMEVVEKV